ncbi:DUF4349 domain-containing protein [Psychrobacillus vulpis]|uniref:DUF4349 domain-containing protein n=1 Tax=Psychrobacillus vulpis TaxID=2325572 RepID=A0A544TS92_9BACI|nr:DUF4349 domain-containing protein [Psychrobacillus vulpis]TQR20314.1 DUF4349 domain-containing protein [Psychrobacillus vulpis]
MKKVIYYLLLSSLFVLLSACSDSESMYTEESKKEMANDSADYSDEGVIESEELPKEESATASSEVKTERMIIHQAFIRTNVKELTKAQSNIEQKVKKYGGYIVESNVYKEDDQTSSGNMIVRIPEKHFETFLSDAEGEASKVLERKVTGQDVTEQYVDLTSRVKSKRVVEERLLKFMGDAQKTEDLLKISEDLAKIQEEIEVLVGKLQYLENQTSFSTIELTMIESRVIVPEKLDSDELNTWEKTKKQFITSTNGLLAAGSAIVVFFIGNLPILLLIAVPVFVAYWIIKKRKQKSQLQ